MNYLWASSKKLVDRYKKIIEEKVAVAAAEWEEKKVAMAEARVARKAAGKKSAATGGEAGEAEEEQEVEIDMSFDAEKMLVGCCLSCLCCLSCFSYSSCRFAPPLTFLTLESY
jgi:hypothetical protein